MPARHSQHVVTFWVEHVAASDGANLCGGLRTMVVTTAQSYRPLSHGDT